MAERMDSDRDITTGELWRRLRELIADLHDKYVEVAVYEARHAAMRERVDHLERRIDANEAKSLFYFRAIIVGVLLPLIVIIVSLYIKAP